MNKITLKADKREITGRKVKTLRKEGLIPANVFGKNIKSSAIQISADDFKKVYKEAGETGLIELNIGSDKRNVLISNIQKNPLTEEMLHIDFRQVDLKEKIKAMVPLELVGESEAVKQGLGTLVEQIDEVEVEALPTELPEKFEMDISGLVEVDQSIHVKDIKYDKTKVTILTDLEEIVAKVEPLQKVEEPVVAETPAEGEEGAVSTATETTEGVSATETPAEEGK